MSVLITNQRGKEHLVKAFEEAGAEVVSRLEDGIRLIVPTVDEELPFFAKAKEWFKDKGITVMIGSDYTIDMCRDKAEFYRFCKRHGFDTPTTMQDNLIVKPRFGKASREVIRLNRSHLVQEYIDAPELSIDYFADFEGNVLSVIPRHRLQVVNGESTQMQIPKDFNHYDEVKRLGKELGLVGHNVIQGFWFLNRFIFTEVNCRFGGGSWMTFKYFNSPKWLAEYALSCSQ